jgi:hypothetical protein
VVRLITDGPLELLLSWISHPDVAPRQELARWLPWFVAPSLHSSGMYASDQPVAQFAVDAAAGTLPAAGVRFGGVWAADTLTVGVRQFVNDTFEIAIVLDDRAPALGPDHKDAWRQWLRFANLLNFRSDLPTWIGTRSMLAEMGGRAGTAPTFEAAQEQSRVEIALHEALERVPEWAAAYREALDSERRILVDLLDLSDSGIEAPIIGAELGDGIPIPMMWHSRHIAVRPDEIDDADLRDLVDEGWTFVDPNAEDIRSAIRVSLGG